MLIKNTNIEYLNIIKDTHFEDHRGFFNRYYEKETIKKNKIKFIPSYQALVDNKKKGIIRGLHLQNKPFEEIKLVKCVKGSIFDVVIDLRRKSKTFLNIFKIKLKFGDGLTLLVPKGCAHGYQTLEINTKVLYSIQGTYMKSSENGIRWDDPFFNIKWPIKKKYLSQKDKHLKNFHI